MAVIHRTTVTPTKLELLTSWLPARAWYAGGVPALVNAGGFRLDDPRGEVGIEFMVVTDTSGAAPRTYLVPLTRTAPAPGPAAGPGHRAGPAPGGDRPRRRLLAPAGRHPRAGGVRRPALRRQRRAWSRALVGSGSTIVGYGGEETSMAGIGDPPQRKSDRTRAAILRAARRQFTTVGYDRASVRSIATEADIDPSMVIRYFGSKAALFAAAVDVDLALPDLAAVSTDSLGEVLTRHFLRRWEGDLHDDAILLLLRSAATHEEAAQRARELFRDQMLAALRAVLPAAGELPRRAGLVASQLLGLALCRYLLRLPPVVRMSPAAVVRTIGPTVQRYLTGPLD
jgi:AcrR family transcriptional regulator